MIQKYTYGTPFETDAIVTSIPASELKQLFSKNTGLCETER